MRVLQVMECTIGGTRRHLRDLAHGLHRRGVEVELAVSTLREPAMADDVEALRTAGMRVHLIPMRRAISPPRDAFHALRLAAVVFDRRFDVVHSHSSKAGALARAVACLCSGAVRVHTPHTYAASFEGGMGQGGQAPGPLGIIMAIERLLGHVTDRLVHVSEGERAEGQALGVVSPARARVVPNGIDAAPFARPAGGQALRAAFGIAPSARVVGTVGLLNDAKGHDVLVDALPLLPRDVVALVVGSGELEQPLRERAARLGVAERLVITGWRDDLPACHDAMDLFCLPSRWEGLSYALLEAGAAGLALVSTEVNGSADVIAPAGEPPCGLMVPREDPVALAAAIGALLDDPVRRARAGELAARRVAEHFSLESMVDGVLAVYEEALGRRRANASRAVRAETSPASPAGATW